MEEIRAGDPSAKLMVMCIMSFMNAGGEEGRRRDRRRRPAWAAADNGVGGGGLGVQGDEDKERWRDDSEGKRQLQL